MQNFSFSLPVQVFFGKGQLKHLSAAMEPYGKNVLLVYGGGSIKRTGLYDKVKDVLKACTIFELGGVEPNPRVSTVRKGVDICRKEGIDILLAVGGGSTIDCSKAIAAAVFYEGDAWDMVLNSRSKAITKALPIAAVLTLAATGSEMDGAAVISNDETKEKLSIMSPALLPKIAVMDPENTFTVPASQTAAGSADILSHVMEVYFGAEDTYMTDRICEAIMKTVVHYAPLAMREPDNYVARANLMWASSWAINGLTNAGKAHDWSCHYIEHELSAYYDITHGVGLAIVTPRWMRHVLSDRTLDKFTAFAVNVWGCDANLAPYELAEKGIEALEAFYKELAIPMTLRELNITTDENFAAMAQHAVDFTGIGSVSYVPLTTAEIVGILKQCL